MKGPSPIRGLVRSILALLLGLGLAFVLMYGLAHIIRSPGRPAAVRPAVVPRAVEAGKPARKMRMRLVPPKAVTVAEAKKREPPKPKPVEDLNGQVVETARPTVEQRPDQARYLGRYDMKVEREVKSKGRKTPGQDLGHLRVERPSALQSPQSTSAEPTRIPDVRHERRERPGAERKRAASAQEPGPDKAEQRKPLVGPGKAPQVAQAEAERPRPSSPVVRGAHDGLLLPATSPGNVLHNIQALAGAPGSNDYLPDVDDEGETNLLNTRKFRYWDFFNRVKDKVSSEWEPGRVWRARDPHGNRYGVKDRLTILRVTLDPEGVLKRVAVHQRSGLDFLDDEAERAFTAAGPFPNPPAGLRNANGEIEFQFGFMFEISTQRFKFYRVQP